MIIWGWGKVTKKIVGQAFQQQCNYCNREEVWQLCIVRTWFTLFFIPILSYKKRHCLLCPNCGSYMELTEDQFEKMKLDLKLGSCNNNNNSAKDSLKYAGKTEAQINYLKQMDEYRNKNINEKC